MPTEYPEDNYLTIRLLSYDMLADQKESYYFLEMSTLQATTLLPADRKIKSCKVIAYTQDDKYLDEKTVSKFETIKDFNDFFIKNTDYYIHNCDLGFSNGTVVSSHDDGEVAIQFPTDNVDQIFINDIFDKFNLSKTIIETLKSKPGHYFGVDKQNNITADFENFDDYVKNGRRLHITGANNRFGQWRGDV